MDYYRIAVCIDTGKEVVQISDGESWLCLHNTGGEQKDAEKVALFKEAIGD
jgi:hypothetical protein